MAADVARGVTDDAVEDNRVAVVTGAGGALGRATVNTLADEGWQVVAVGRTVDALPDLPPGVRREAADLTDPAVVDTLFERIASRPGQLRAVVHAAGGFRGGSVVDTDKADLAAMLDVNLETAWWVSRAAGRWLRAIGGGAIVHVAARNGLEASAGAAAYAVSKAALVQLVRVLDAELRTDGVRVNAVVPGLIDTPANREVLPAEVMARAVAPEAIARVIAFLVSDDAAPVVGALIPVYGTG